MARNSISKDQLELDFESLARQVQDQQIWHRLKQMPPTYYTPAVAGDPSLKAWPTPYKGCNYRSRTEARWACAFDVLGIETVYEMEKIKMPRGVSIPDFYLPGFDTWVEVGPNSTEIHESKQEKGLRLATATGRPVLITRGFSSTTVHSLLEGCTLALPEPHQVTPETIAKNFPLLRALSKFKGPAVRAAVEVARNFQFEAVRDHSA